MSLKFSYLIFLILHLNFKILKRSRKLNPLIIEAAKLLIENMPKPIFYKLDKLGDIKGADLNLIMKDAPSRLSVNSFYSDPIYII